MRNVRWKAKRRAVCRRRRRIAINDSERWTCEKRGVRGPGRKRPFSLSSWIAVTPFGEIAGIG